MWSRKFEKMFHSFAWTFFFFFFILHSFYFFIFMKLHESRFVSSVDNGFIYFIFFFRIDLLSSYSYDLAVPLRPYDQNRIQDGKIGTKRKYKIWIDTVLNYLPFVLFVAVWINIKSNAISILFVLHFVFCIILLLIRFSFHSLPLCRRKKSCHSALNASAKYNGPCALFTKHERSENRNQQWGNEK